MNPKKAQPETDSENIDGGLSVQRAPSVVIFNPLPNALHHYVLELQETLERCGVTARLFPSTGVEGVRGVFGKVRTLLSHVRAARAAANSSSTVICVWPVVGWYELALWSVQRRRNAGRNLLIFHDPTPLRSQIGLSRRAARNVSLFSLGRRPSIATHSSNAADIVRSLLGTVPLDLLHPILTEGSEPSGAVASRQPRVGVFGQYKPSRDVDLLSGLPSLLDGYELRMAGTGWPKIDGWDQDTRFLTELELTDSIREVDVVLIPYTAYYQSGIALRAMEQGVPVVGAPTPFLLDLFGVGSAGIVETDSVEDWVAAIRRASAMPVGVSRENYQRRLDSGWRGWLFG